MDRILGVTLQGLDDVLGCGKIGVTHAQIDDIDAPGGELGLEAVNF